MRSFLRKWGTEHIDKPILYAYEFLPFLRKFLSIHFILIFILTPQ